jgi:hypothetical protein
MIQFFLREFFFSRVRGKPSAAIHARQCGARKIWFQLRYEKNAPAARVEKALKLQLSIEEEHTMCLMKGLYMMEQWGKRCELRIQEGRCRQNKTTQEKAAAGSQPKAS